MSDNDNEYYYEIYRNIWQNIAREEVLVNNRLSWSLTLSAALATLLITILNIFLPKNFSELLCGISVGQKLLIAFSFLSSLGGLIFTYHSYRGVKAAFKQISELISHYNGMSNNFSRLGLPRPFGQETQHQHGKYSAIIYSIILITFWALISLVLFLLLTILPPR